MSGSVVGTGTQCGGRTSPGTLGVPPVNGDIDESLGSCSAKRLKYNTGEKKGRWKGLGTQPPFFCHFDQGWTWLIYSW